MKKMISPLMFLCIFGFFSVCNASVLEKYKNISITIEQLERIVEYDHLIKYYCKNMLLYGEQNRVEPNFLRALILAESNVKKDAVSIDNAFGLTQITYETGNQALREIEKKRRKIKGINTGERNNAGNVNLTVDDLLKPNWNIFLATYLISKYNFKYEGRLDLVVSAWNAGPASIKKDMPPNYSETLDIIGKVNGYYHSLIELKTRGISFLKDI